jgi:hypothetical protein
MAVKVFPLPQDVESMCSFCLKKATHFIVVSYSYGDFKPACPDHAREDIF